MIDKEDSIEFIERLFGEGDLSNGGLNISVVCPMCKPEKDNDYSKKKLVIRTDDHRVHCWVCGYRSKTLVHLTRKSAKFFGISVVQEYQTKFLANIPGCSDTLKAMLLQQSSTGIELFDDYLEDVETVVEESPELPEGFIFLAEVFESTKNSWYVKKHIDYLKNERGITDIDDIWYWKFCIAPIEDKEFSWRIIIPSFDSMGKLNYYSGRNIKQNGYKYWNSLGSKKNIIFNEHVIDWKKPVLLVEGPFDLTKTKLATTNAIPILGKTITEQYRLAQKIIENKTPVILALDPEEIKDQIKMADFFSSFGIEVSSLEYPEWVDDIGAISNEQVLELYQTNVKKYDTMTELRKRIERI